MLRQGLIAILLLVMSACAVASDQEFLTTFESPSLPLYSTSQLGVIKKRGYIKVGIFTQNSEPFVIEKNHQLTGIDIELASILAQHLGVKVVFDTSAKTMNELIKQVYNHQDDIAMSGIIRTLARGESVYMSSPYYKFQVGMLANRSKFDQLNTDLISTFNKPTTIIGQLRDSAFIDYVHFLYPKAKIRVFPTTQGVFNAVQSGEIDATMIDKVGAQAWLMNKPQRALTTRYYLQPNLYAEYVIITSYDYPILGKWLDLATQQATDVGYVDQLLQKYTTGNINERY